MRSVVSIDIGSTWTKGACFRLEGGRLAAVRRKAVPTTVHHLAEGFFQLLEALEPPAGAPVHFSSSAKGGLAIAAIGIVPGLTLKAARLTALSAGGKVNAVFPYKLGRRQVQELEAADPDIVLLSGGTDGGNETYVLHNLGMLKTLSTRPVVIYAGNEILAERVCLELAEAGLTAVAAPNLMPEVDRLVPEGARAEIRQVFLDRIVQGKGLDEIVARTGRAPQPTPCAVMSLVEAVRRQAPDFGDFLLVDMGGATTDVYSSTSGQPAAERVILRGLKEPEVKRTVEGDLGMRVSARAAARTGEAVVRRLLGEDAKVGFEAYLDRIEADPGRLGGDGAERSYDEALASACIHHALQRHAGTFTRVFAAEGEVHLQEGKDLRAVRKLIGSGGYLGAARAFTPTALLQPAPGPQERIPLVPRACSYYRDKDYLFPLLGNLAADFEREAARGALGALELVHEELVEIAG